MVQRNKHGDTAFSRNISFTQGKEDEPTVWIKQITRCSSKMCDPWAIVLLACSLESIPHLNVFSLMPVWCLFLVYILFLFTKLCCIYISSAILAGSCDPNFCLLLLHIYRMLSRIHPYEDRKIYKLDVLLPLLASNWMYLLMALLDNSKTLAHQAGIKLLRCPAVKYWAV